MTDAVVARLDGVSHRYGATVALDDVTIEVPARKMVGVIGPDGVGKSTMLALISGVRTVQSGKVIVFDGDVTKRSHLKGLRARVAYMPQGLGRNLSDAERVRKYRFLRPAVRAIGVAAARQDH
jgi:ribosome-dependent ATPase